MAILNNSFSCSPQNGYWPEAQQELQIAPSFIHYHNYLPQLPPDLQQKRARLDAASAKERAQIASEVVQFYLENMGDELFSMNSPVYYEVQQIGLLVTTLKAGRILFSPSVAAGTCNVNMHNCMMIAPLFPNLEILDLRNRPPQSPPYQPDTFRSCFPFHKKLTILLFESDTRWSGVLQFAPKKSQRLMISSRPLEEQFKIASHIASMLFKQAAIEGASNVGYILEELRRIGMNELICELDISYNYLSDNLLGFIASYCQNLQKITINRSLWRDEWRRCALDIPTIRGYFFPHLSRNLQIVDVTHPPQMPQIVEEREEKEDMQEDMQVKQLSTCIIKLSLSEAPTPSPQPTPAPVPIAPHATTRKPELKKRVKVLQPQAPAKEAALSPTSAVTPASISAAAPAPTPVPTPAPVPTAPHITTRKPKLKERVKVLQPQAPVKAPAPAPTAALLAPVPTPAPAAPAVIQPQPASTSFLGRLGSFAMAIFSKLASNTGASPSPAAPSVAHPPAAAAFAALQKSESRQAAAVDIRTSTFDLRKHPLLSSSSVYSQLEKIINQYPNLSTLYLPSGVPLNDSIGKLLSRLTKLTRLDISLCDKCDLSGLHHLQQLTELHNEHPNGLSDDASLSTQGFKLICTKLKKLQVLHLGYLNMVNNDAFGLLKELTRLQELSFHSPLITTAGIRKIEAMPLLRKLSILKCPKLDDSTLLAVVDQFQNLVELVTGDNRFTDEGFSVLRRLRGLRYTNTSAAQKQAEKKVEEKKEGRERAIPAEASPAQSLILVAERGETLDLQQVDLHSFPMWANAVINQHPNLTSLQLPKRADVDEPLIRTLAAGLKKLTILKLNQMRIEDNSLTLFKLFAGLTALHFERAQITYKSIGLLAPLRNLNALFLEDCLNINDVAIEAIVNQFPVLELLFLRKNSITDAAIAHLNKLPKLRVLTVADQDKLTSVGWRKIASITTLEELVVKLCPQLTAADLAWYDEMPHLRSIHMDSSR